MKIISKLVSLTVLLVACGVRAASVDTADVTAAAKTWAARGAALGAQIGTGGVDSATAYAVTNGYSFYAVKLTGGGTVFFSSDTEFEPIIAFSPNSNINLSNEKNPLLQLLRRDIIARVGLSNLRKASRTAGASTQSAADDKSALKWAALLAANPKSSRTGAGSSATTSSAAPVQIVDDICVAPLLTTKWDQTTSADGMPCFNYYMWDELGGKPSTTDVWPCGCSATALAQVMRYFRYPTAEQKAKAFDCGVNGVSVSLSTKAGAFDWDNMVDFPGGTYNITAAQREAIGHLTWNVAVALKSWFTEDLGSAQPYGEPVAIRDTFGYANAWLYWDAKNWYKGSGGLHDQTTREKIVHANLDAGRPVVFSIYGYPSEHVGDYNYWVGHAVVGDGYGYQTVNGEKTVYVHINMGWSGIDDMWYNIPEINAANSGAYIVSSNTDFLYMSGATFNIATTEAGEILSGRTYDEDGQPMAGAVVSAYKDGVLVGSTVSSEYGVYSFTLPGGHAYTVSAQSADGKYVSVPLRDIALTSTVGDSGYIVSSEANVGNSWGNDLVLEHPSVRIGTAIYGSLDAAIEAVKSAGLVNPVIEIVDSTGLRESATIDFACTIVSTNADPLATLITREDGAQLTVADGGAVAFTNVAFASEVKDSVLVSVAAGGSISVAGTVGLGHIVTEDASGFVLAGAIEPVEMGVVLGAAGETTVRGTVFGLYTCSTEVASANAAKIIKYDDDEFGGAADEAGQLIWDRVPVDPSAALAVATNDKFGTTYYRSLNQLFADYTNGAEIVILKDCATNTFTKPLTISKAVTICSRGTPRVIQPASTACITIKDGGSLTIANLTFSEFTGRRLFWVVGGSLTLEDGATLENLTGTGYEDDYEADEDGAVRMDRGTLMMMPGSLIANCSVETDSGGLGGGIAAIGGTLNLKGGTITGCSAMGTGGGVYSYAATVNLSGDVQVTGNVNAKGETDNIYLEKKSTLSVVGALGEESAVGVRSATTANNAIGKTFATVKASLTAAQRTATAAAFSCDANAALYATTQTASGTTKLVWAEKIDDGTCDQSEAVVRVVYPKSTTYPKGTNLYYSAVTEAFARLTGAATVEILTDTTFEADLTVSQAVTLVSSEASPLTLARTMTSLGNPARIVVTGNGSLTVTNITLSGANLAETKGRAMIEVEGTLTLKSGAKVANVRSTGSDAVAARGAILVSGGTLTMESGSVIADCTSVAEEEEYGAGAGVYLIGGTAYFNGGSITNCSATSLAGVCAVKNSKIYVSGDFTVDGNSLQYYYPTVKSNLSAAGNSELYLTGPLTGRIGYTTAEYASETTFGKIPNWKSWTFQNLTNSAAQFRNDLTDKRGVVVTNSASVALLVWESALNSNGSYTDDSVENGATYWVTAIPAETSDEPMPIVVPCEPFTITHVQCVSDGVWELTLNPATVFCTYRLYGADDLSSIINDANLKVEKTLEASDVDADGGFTMQVESPTSQQFWRIVGEAGERYE